MWQHNNKNCHFAVNLPELPNLPMQWRPVFSNLPLAFKNTLQNTKLYKKVSKNINYTLKYIPYVTYFAHIPLVYPAYNIIIGIRAIFRHICLMISNF